MLGNPLKPTLRAPLWLVPTSRATFLPRPGFQFYFVGINEHQTLIPHFLPGCSSRCGGFVRIYQRTKNTAVFSSALWTGEALLGPPWCPQLNTSNRTRPMKQLLGWASPHHTKYKNTTTTKCNTISQSQDLVQPPAVRSKVRSLSGQGRCEPSPKIMVQLWNLTFRGKTRISEDTRRPSQTQINLKSTD